MLREKIEKNKIKKMIKKNINQKNDDQIKYKK
jgi:hypothetical protein